MPEYPKIHEPGLPARWLIWTGVIPGVYSSYIVLLTDDKNGYHRIPVEANIVGASVLAPARVTYANIEIAKWTAKEITLTPAWETTRIVRVDHDPMEVVVSVEGMNIHVQPLPPRDPLVSKKHYLTVHTVNPDESIPLLVETDAVEFLKRRPNQVFWRSLRQDPSPRYVSLEFDRPGTGLRLEPFNDHRVDVSLSCISCGRYRLACAPTDAALHEARPFSTVIHVTMLPEGTSVPIAVVGGP